MRVVFGVVGLKARTSTSFAGTTAMPLKNDPSFNQVGSASTVKALRLSDYTVATLPSASENAGRLIYVSNGAAGSPCLAYSNGTSWLRILLGAAVATS